MTNTVGFQPNWASAPGETIRSLLEQKGLKNSVLAEGLGLDMSYVGKLLKGQIEIDTSLAQKLGNFVGRTAEFWLAREKQYRERLKSLASGENFLAQLPILDMVKFGWLKPVEKREDMFRQCLEFFQVPNIEKWELVYRDVIESAAFRTSLAFDSETGAVSAWLREGERRAEMIAVNPWNRKKFAAALAEIRTLTRENDPEVFIPRLVQLCADAGVAAVILRAPSGCRASGATRIVGNRVMLLLSFRYLSNDHFWFTFFHEAGHILLHHTRQLFVDSPGKTDSKDEKEADNFAANFLIPETHREELLGLSSNSRNVIRFARRIGIAPGIVVGHLQHNGRIGRNQLNRLKRRFSWED